VLLTVAMTVRGDALQPVFLGIKNPLIVKNYHSEDVFWKSVPSRRSFPNKHTVYRASS
jgi:hypothetical protein